MIDLFAGPGGLGEGFASFTDTHKDYPFDIRLSAEKDPVAQQTLELRTFLRAFRGEPVFPREYAEFLRGKISREQLLSHYPNQASRARDHAQLFELGESNRKALEARLDALALDRDRTVVIGGPPCQAYSLAGRSRNGAKGDWSLETDHRSHLYREYLHVLAHVQPVAFVMENVKGLLSARLNGESLFNRILEDLGDPVRAVGKRGARRRYRIVPIVKPLDNPTPSLFSGRGNLSPSSFIVRAEQHGVPQARHRVILLGICESTPERSELRLKIGKTRKVWDAIGSLPALRSGVSGIEDSWDGWYNTLRDTKKAAWWGEIEKEVATRICEALDRTRESVLYREAHVVRMGKRLHAVVNHQTRGHMPKDLHRYLFAAAWADLYGESPTLRDYPPSLLPDHANVKQALTRGHFGDRFRVQVWNSPSSTVVSHISKDGHYYIHPDPAQCRSLTVREAARLQTFPDDYWFCGPRTMQYHQVGNAVPVQLARQIAALVHAHVA
ncbi:MAG: DNA cytosine methyltransferase [Gemmatimonadaceae bacterium]|nr:DNA cytosine methyltransferase [Gemmatimonadaceae bacterium]